MSHKLSWYPLPQISGIFQTYVALPQKPTVGDTAFDTNKGRIVLINKLSEPLDNLVKLKPMGTNGPNAYTDKAYPPCSN